jgi:hypothetical protein
MSETIKKTLSIRPRLGLAERQAPAEVEQAIRDAFARSVCISATYNSTAVVLQPVLMFEEHDALFLMAATILRDGKPPREIKTGIFRLAGMTNVRPARGVQGIRVPMPEDWAAGRPTRRLVTSLETPSA